MRKRRHFPPWCDVLISDVAFCLVVSEGVKAVLDRDWGWRRLHLVRVDAARGAPWASTSMARIDWAGDEYQGQLGKHELESVRFLNELTLIDW